MISRMGHHRSGPRRYASGGREPVFQAKILLLPNSSRQRGVLAFRQQSGFHLIFHFQTKTSYHIKTHKVASASPRLIFTTEKPANIEWKATIPDIRAPAQAALLRCVRGIDIHRQTTARPLIHDDRRRRRDLAAGRPSWSRAWPSWRPVFPALGEADAPLRSAGGGAAGRSAEGLFDARAVSAPPGARRVPVASSPELVRVTIVICAPQSGRPCRRHQHGHGSR